MVELDDEDRLDLIFAALANRRRRQIVESLALHPASIAQLAAAQGASLPAIHRHILALEEAELVQRRKSGRVNFLALTRSGVVLAQDWLAQFHPYWGSAEESLDNYIAGIARATKTATVAASESKEKSTTESDTASTTESESEE
jgi:DNA-binding transcriptional ArsR family regulator